MDVSVVIVSYNSREVLRPCLDSLARQTLFGRVEVIVVDNASADDSAGFVRDNYSWVRLLAGDENVGFSRGVNAGILAANGRHILILNPDTLVRDDALERMVSFMDATPDAGIVAPKLVFHDGNLQYSCRRFYNWKVLVLRRTPAGKLFKNSKAVSDHLMTDYDHETTREVDWVLGAAMLVRREAIESVGLMDERFFLYFEDVDWCYRMHQKGWKVYYFPEVEVVHDYARDSATSVINRSFVAHLASLFRYYEKWNRLLYFFKKYREILKVLLFIFIDLIAFNLAFLSAYYLRVALGGIFPNPIFPIGSYERFVVFENLLFVVTYFAAGLYRVRRDTQSVDELFSIARAIVVASILLMASTYLSHIRTYSRMIVAFVVPFAILYDWGLRSLVRRAHRSLLVQKIDLKPVCIVGPAEEARRLERTLSRDARQGVDVVGIIDSGGEGGGASLDTIEKVVDEHRVQEIIVLSGALPEGRLADVVLLGRRRVLDITVLTDYSGLVMHQATITVLGGRPVIAYRRDTRYVVDRTAKRLLDILLGSFFLVLSVPCIVLYSIYALIRGRTPFTSDERVGLRGQPFKLPIAGDRSANGPSDIVNLPLFWLVIRGKLSMVGPYPLPTADAAVVEEVARFRNSVRPGVTGYWRIGNARTVSRQDLFAGDANYTQNWSFVQDLKILVMSFGNMIRGKKRILTIE